MFDMFRYEMEIDELNRDIIMNNVVSMRNSKLPEIDYARFISPSASDSFRKTMMLKNNNYAFIRDVIRRNIELLNFSELNAHLFNFISDIKHKKYIAPSDFTGGSEQLESVLIKQSDVYATYYGLSLALKTILQYASADAKRDYAETIMSVVYANKTPQPDDKYPFGRTFRNADDQLDASSTDEFLKMLISKCEQFMTDCREIYLNANQLVERLTNNSYLAHVYRQRPVNESRRPDKQTEIMQNYLERLLNFT